MSVAEKYLEGLRSLVQQTEEAVTAADAGDWDAMLYRLGQRQILMTSIDEMAVQPGQVAPEQQDVARRLLERMVSLDQKASRKVAVALANTRSAMDEARHAHTTVSAYRKTLSPTAQAYPAKFMDKQR